MFTSLGCKNLLDLSAEPVFWGGGVAASSDLAAEMGKKMFEVQLGREEQRSRECKGHSSNIPSVCKNQIVDSSWLFSSRGTATTPTSAAHPPLTGDSTLWWILRWTHEKEEFSISSLISSISEDGQWDSGCEHSYFLEICVSFKWKWGFLEQKRPKKLWL